VLLAAWAIALVAGPAALPIEVLLAAGAIAIAFGGVLMPSLTRLGRHHAWASTAEPAVFAFGFALVVIAATVVVSGAAIAIFALLLAALGLPAQLGMTLFAVGTSAGALVAGGALAWGFATHGGDIEVTERRVEIAGLAPALAGLRIAHLSDLHIGNGTDAARIGEIVARTQATGADLVVVTGDLFDNDAEVVDAGAAALGALRAPLGVYAILGNHDGFVGAAEVAAALAARAPGIALLRGRCVRVPTPAPLWIAGFDDPGHEWKSGEPTPELDALAAQCGTHEPTVLLMHRPDSFPRAAQHGFALVLSGHFHGGQVALPVARGRWNAAKLLTRFDRGLYRHGNASLYVSRGLGFAGPRLRFASRPEIAVIELA
jgi:hypothetical protein